MTKPFRYTGRDPYLTVNEFVPWRSASIHVSDDSMANVNIMRHGMLIVNIACSGVDGCGHVCILCVVPIISSVLKIKIAYIGGKSSCRFLDVV